jgi:hypothetical protein
MMEVAHSRDIVADLINNHAHPQVLVRLGTVPKPEGPDSPGSPGPTPRRRLDEVLQINH